MTTQTSNYIEAIGHLPPGGTLILTNVPWKDYERLVTDQNISSGVRISYDQGRMEIMSPSQKHERYKELISRLAYVLAEELDLQLENLGSSTYKQEWLARGVEPDACFYLQHAAFVIGKERIDLRVDPPPDVVVEIDVAHDSRSKMVIYAGMNVPELWRYDEKHLQIFHLSENVYVEMARSLAFPMLTSDVLTRFLEQSKTEGQTATARSFREWFETQR